MKKKKKLRRTPPKLAIDDLRTMEQDRLRPLENELRVEHAMKGLHAAKRIIECTAFIPVGQRPRHEAWLKRFG